MLRSVDSLTAFWIHCCPTFRHQRQTFCHPNLRCPFPRLICPIREQLTPQPKPSTCFRHISSQSSRLYYSVYSMMGGRIPESLSHISFVTMAIQLLSAYSFLKPGIMTPIEFALLTSSVPCISFLLPCKQREASHH